MADKKITQLDPATLPLSGTELVEIVQSGVNKKVATSEIGAGGSQNLQQTYDNGGEDFPYGSVVSNDGNSTLYDVYSDGGGSYNRYFRNPETGVDSSIGAAAESIILFNRLNYLITASIEVKEGEPIISRFDSLNEFSNKLKLRFPIANTNIFVPAPAVDGDYTLALEEQIPTDLAQLGEDATHRVVTDAEKASWNAVIGGSVFQTTWNATTNSPSLVSSTGTKGFYYIVATAGSTNLNGITDWKVGDWAIFDGTVWRKVDNTDAVSSVNSLTGAVSLDTSNVPDTLNKRYQTDAQQANNDATSSIQTQINGKQATLVSGTNLKTVNSTSLLGSGNVAVEPTITATTSADYYRGDKTFATLNKTAVGLSNVDNTSDANKPVSTAQQTAIDLKLNKSASSYTMRANNTGSTADVTDFTFKQVAQQTYSGTETWIFGASAPSGASNKNYSWSQIGNTVTVRMNLVYATQGGTVTGVLIPFPTDLPAPLIPTGLSGASNILYQGSGLIMATLSTGTTSAGRGYIRRNAADNGFELAIIQASNSAIAAWITVTYLTN